MPFLDSSWSCKVFINLSLTSGKWFPMSLDASVMPNFLLTLIRPKTGLKMYQPKMAKLDKANR